MNHSGKAFFILGLSFVGMGGLLIFTGIKANAAPSSTSFLLLAMAVMSFCLSYLYPQFKQKDERMKLIRQKGMFASFIAMMIYLIVFIIGLQLDFFTITANQLVHILTALMICTVFISFVVYSKIH